MPTFEPEFLPFTERFQCVIFNHEYETRGFFESHPPG